MITVAFCNTGRQKLNWESEHHTLTPKTLYKEIKRRNAMMSGIIGFTVNRTSNEGQIFVSAGRVVGSLLFSEIPDDKHMRKHWETEDGDTYTGDWGDI